MARKFHERKALHAQTMRRRQKFAKAKIPAYDPAPPVRAATRGPRHHFFGDNDRCPWSPSGRYLLAMETPFGHRVPAADDIADVGVVDLEYAGRYISLADTTAWNWRRGAAVQWLPDRQDPDCFLFHRFAGKKLVSAVLDTQCRLQREYDRPLYALAPDGSRAVALDCRRLTAWRPAYGYAAFGAGERGAPDTADDGIWLVDMASGKAKLVLSFRALREWACDRPERVGGACVYRPAFSPDGRRLAFLYASQSDTAPIHRQLLTLSVDGNDLYCVARGFVSHFAWLPDNTILTWCGLPAGAIVPPAGTGWFARMRRWADRFSHARRMRALRPGYRLFRDGASPLRDIGAAWLTEPGHPVPAANGRRLIADTGAGKRKDGSLVLYDMDLDRAGLLGVFPVAPALTETVPCRLNPRLSPDGKQIAFDACHEGTRQIYLMDIG